MKRAIITVQGLVQGIGFRPFVYRLAIRNHLNGYVKNLGDAGVRIDVSGDEERIQELIRDLRDEKIPLAVYTNVDVEWHEGNEEVTSFIIDNSDLDRDEVRQSLIPPDVSICSDCLREVFDSSARHYIYPFTCCALCGPRFTTITDIPYDRERTTMNYFPFCDDCNNEFFEPIDRRFNAQTICCPQCGPKMTLYHGDGTIMNSDNPLEVAARLILEGHTVAVKGIGGIHLAIKATEDHPIIRLRERRRKPGKPFALMSPSIDESHVSSKTHCRIEEKGAFLPIKIYFTGPPHRWRHATIFRHPLPLIPLRRYFSPHHDLRELSWRTHVHKQRRCIQEVKRNRRLPSFT
jgi:hydrogenase maturation protein HypF